MTQQDTPESKVRCAALTSHENSIFFMRSAEHPHTLYVSKLHRSADHPNLALFCLLGVASNLLVAPTLPAPDLDRPDMRAAKASGEVGIVARYVCAEYTLRT